MADDGASRPLLSGLRAKAPRLTPADGMSEVYDRSDVFGLAPYDGMDR